MSYIDLATIQSTDPGDPLTAAWCDTVRDNFEFLIDPPTCSVFNSVAVSVPSGGSGTFLTADSELFDNDSMHSTVSSTGRITAQTAGRYLFSATLAFQAGSTGQRNLALRTNGSTVTDIAQVNNAGGSATVVLSGVKSLVLGVGDFVEVRAFHIQGSNLNVTLQEFSAMFLTRA